MNSIAQYDAILEFLTVFLIFIACYMGFALFAFVCLFIADLIFESAEKARERYAESTLENGSGPSAARPESQGLRHPFRDQIDRQISRYLHLLLIL